MGNRSLIAAERKVSLICHRADAALFEQQKAAVLKAARIISGVKDDWWK